MADMHEKENFGHPEWDRLTNEEKKNWLHQQIGERIEAEYADGEEDAFLASCFEELDRLTDAPALSEEHIEKRLQAVLASRRTVSETYQNTASRLPKRLFTALVACLMLIVLTPPAYAYMIETRMQSQNSYLQRGDIRLSVLDWAEVMQITLKGTESGESYVPQQPHGVYTYHSVEEFLLDNKGFDLLYPLDLPEQYRIKYITLNIQNKRNWYVSFKFYGLMVERYTIQYAPYQNENYRKGEASEEWTYNGRSVYIIEETKSNGEICYHAYHSKNHFRYHIVTTNKDMLRILVDHTFS